MNNIIPEYCKGCFAVFGDYCCSWSEPIKLASPKCEEVKGGFDSEGNPREEEESK